MTLGRQDVAFAREPHRGTAIPNIDPEFSSLAECFCGIRRQAAAHLHFISFAVRQPIDAQLLGVCRDAGWIATINRHELRKVGLGAAQIFRKLNAQARLCCIVLNFVIDEAEAVLGLQLRDLLNDVG